MSEVPQDCRLPGLCGKFVNCEEISQLPLSVRHPLLIRCGHFLIAFEGQIDDCGQKPKLNCIAGSEMVTDLIMRDSAEFVEQRLGIGNKVHY